MATKNELQIKGEMTEKNVIKSKFVLTIISYSFFKAAQLLQFSSLLHLNLSFVPTLVHFQMIFLVFTSKLKLESSFEETADNIPRLLLW